MSVKGFQAYVDFNVSCTGLVALIQTLATGDGYCSNQHICSY